MCAWVLRFVVTTAMVMPMAAHAAFKCIDADGNVYFGDSYGDRANCATVKADPNTNVMESPADSADGTIQKVAPSGAGGGYLIRVRTEHPPYLREGDDVQKLDGPPSSTEPNSAALKNYEAAMRRHDDCMDNADLQMKRAGDNPMAMAAATQMMSLCAAMLSTAPKASRKAKIAHLPNLFYCKSDTECLKGKFCVRPGEAAIRGVCGTVIDHANRAVAMPATSKDLYGVRCEIDAECPTHFECQEVKPTGRKICMNFHTRD